MDDAIANLVKCPPDRLDEMVKLLAANARLTVPITRLVYFKHLTVRQGIAARRYGDIVTRYESYFVDKAVRTTRAQNPEPTRAGEDQEIQRRILDGTIDEYKREARKTRREYDKAMKVLARAVEQNPSDEKLKGALSALQNDKRMKMSAWEPAWWQFHLEPPPVQQQVQFQGGRRARYR
jgi:hypothetical protein